MDRAAYLDSLRVLIEQAPDFTFFFSKPHVEGNVAITPVPFFGTTPEGNRYEWSYVQVVVGDPETGQAVAFEFFDDDQWDDAVERFRELVAPGAGSSAHPSSSEPESTATRRIGEFLARLRAGDTDGIHAFIADGYRYVDHRFSGVSGGAEGFDAFMDQMRAYRDVGFREPTARVLAVRGERFLLSRSENVSGEGYTSVELRIGEHDADGRFVRTDVYDETDLARALADLDARYRESGEATDAELRALDAIDALNRRDWDALRAALDPDVVAVDHQPLGFESTDRDGIVADWMSGLVAMVPDAVSVVAEVFGRGAAACFRIVTRGTTVDGSAYEWDALCAGRFGTGARLEFFPLDRRADALALLEAWAAAEGSPTPAPEQGLLAAIGPTAAIDNDAVRRAVRWYWLSRFGDPHDADGLTADAIAMVDRRAGVSMPAIEGRAAFNQAMAATAEVFSELEIHPIAVRGDRLGLLNIVRSNDGFELSTLVLIELDLDGRMVLVTIFDDRDLAGALEALDARYVQTTVDVAPAEVAALAAYAALDRRDWPGFTAFFDDDLVIVDHRRLGFPPGRGSATFTAALQSLVEQVPDVVAYITSIRTHGRVVLATTHQRGTATGGGEASWDFHTVATVGPDDRIASHEYFDADRWDDAVARFDERSATATVTAEGLARTVTDAFAARDWDVIRGLVGDDVRLVDRRSTVSSHDAVGADAVIELLRGFADVGFVSMENELVAARDGGVNLLRRTFRTESGFELQMLAVAQLAAEGRGGALVIFDVDDLDAATAELDRRAAGATDR
jgi:hypothetical protein